MANNSTTFWKFIKGYQIEIPIIQRDYAQGRRGWENLRKNFLANIRQALDGTLPEKQKILKLDFVYSSTEEGRLQPLDGQQRLTTLWLIHWFVALKAGRLRDAADVLSHFTYETRISSREFCENLCDPDKFARYDNTERVVDYITRQTWFYSVWKQDPTIQSMLRMLGDGPQPTKDSIEGIFVYDTDSSISENSMTYEMCWNILTSDDAPLIFYHLPMKDFGLSDDLYIKMNARGKQLTAFENFKADIVGFITTKAKSDDSWSLELLDPIQGIPIKMDTEWTDLFWKNRSVGVSFKGEKRNANQIDEIYFAFLNRYFWNELFMAKSNGNYTLKIGEGILPNGNKTYTIENENCSYKWLNDDRYDIYPGFDPYKFNNGNLIKELFSNLNLILQRYKSIQTMPECNWDKEFCFIPEYVLDENGENVIEENEFKETYLKITPITQIHRIVFYSLCKYLLEGDADETSLKQWMRVVWNLISGQGEDGRPQIRSTQAVRTAMEFISKINSHDVYHSLAAQSPENRSTYFGDRWNEEIDKAQQIIKGESRSDGKTWEDIIIQAENYSFFHGAIRFLYQDENRQAAWQLFDTKWENAQKFFIAETKPKVSVMNLDYHNMTLHKILFSWFSPDEFWHVLWWRHRIFNNQPESWLYLLLNNGISRPIHHMMLLEVNDDVVDADSKVDFPQHTIFLLSKTNLLDFVREHIPASWIRDYHYHKAIFPSGTGVFLNAEKRDSLLASKEICIDKEHHIEGTNLLYGSDINFKYKVKYFQWYRNNYIYLLDSASHDYTLKDADATDDVDKYFCLNTGDISTEAELYEKLENLINASNA